MAISKIIVYKNSKATQLEIVRIKEEWNRWSYLC